MAGHLISLVIFVDLKICSNQTWILHVFIVSAKNSLCKSVLLVN